MQKIEKLLPSKYYHIYNRGNNKENIFIEDRNYSHFLDLWQKHVTPVCETYSYCLLKNHFHFLVRIRDEEEITKLLPLLNPDRATALKQTALSRLTTQKELESLIINRISKNFSNHFNAYAQAINIAYNRTGKLFETPFERKLVDSEAYFMQLIYYIHFNPQKHGFVKDFRDWPYSSYHSLLSDKPTKLNREKVMEWFIDKKDFIGFHNVEHDSKPIEKLIEGDN